MSNVKIIDETLNNGVPFEHLNEGDTFTVQCTVEGVLFMRTKEIYVHSFDLGINAIKLNTGDIRFFRDDERVLPVDATITYKEITQ